MSGFAAIRQRNGAPVLPEQLDRLTAPIAHRGPDGILTWIGGSVGLAHCALVTTPEAVGVKQPLRIEEAGLSLVFCGRVDNRDDLVPALGLSPHVSDAHIALAACRRWGEDAPGHLWGDFALVLWDERQQRLFCARDLMGVRPFFYHLSDRVFLAGSEPSQLFADPRVQPEANLDYVAGLLNNMSISAGETIHAQVSRLPPAHSLTIQGDRVRLRRYWDITRVPTVRLRSDADYAERFWDLLLDAVRAQSRATAPTGLFLSGGLDSTSIAAAAVDLQRQGRFAAPGLSGYSLVFPGDAVGDESALIREVAAKLELESIALPPTSCGAGEYAEIALRSRDRPAPPNDTMFNGLRRAAGERGVRVMLSGLGADEWFTGNPARYADWLRSGRWGPAWSQLSGDARRQGVSAWRLFREQALKPLCPAWAYRASRAWRGPRRLIPRWIFPHDPARRRELIAKFYPDSSRYHWPAALRTLRGTYFDGDLANILESTERINAQHRLEIRHPFYHRSLIEFGLGLPDEQRLWDGQTKTVMRRAMRGRIPESIRTRPDKAEFSNWVVAEIDRHVGEEFFRDLELARRDWVDAAAVMRMDHEMQSRSRTGDRTQTWHIWPLWNLFGLETLAREGLL